MSTTCATLEADAEDLLRRIAPHELAVTPVYVVSKSAVPVEFGGGSRWGGWTSGTLDLELRELIGDRWRGRGPCVVASGDDRTAFLACAVHEFAHRLDDELVAAPPTDFRPADAARHTSNSLSEAHSIDRQTRHHAPSFVRLVMHLGFRAEAAGEPVLGDCVGYRWLAPYTVDFFRCLYADMTAHSGRPLAGLKHTPPPRELADLWFLAASKCEAIPPAAPPEMNP